ncbi:MAG: cytochrome-c peroxidase [Thermoanaerobaculia bacterium]
MRAVIYGIAAVVLLAFAAAVGAGPATTPPPLGLPPLPIPDDNPQTPEKVALGDKLFHDIRFSSDGTVSCATCHVREKAFTDGPLKVSEGVRKMAGTRNAPTIINAAYYTSTFWDGRTTGLEDQAQHPFINPVEMELADHEPILEIVRTDPAYKKAFKEVFGKSGKDVTMTEVTKALAAFQRTLISGNSPFDRWYFAGEENAITEQQKRGFDLFVNKGRCVSCHTVEQTTALFTDNKFHNIGVGINTIQNDVPELAQKFLTARMTLAEVDAAVLSDAKTSELGRFAITKTLDHLGSFKTSTLRNIALTAPYMHDGSVATLRETVVHYNNGGVTNEGDPVNDFLSGGIRPLNLTDQEIDDIVAFMEALTSPEFAPEAAKAMAEQEKKEKGR